MEEKQDKGLLSRQKALELAETEALRGASELAAEYSMNDFLAENGVTIAPENEPNQEEIIDFDEILAQMDNVIVKQNNNANLPNVKSPQKDVILPSM